MERALPPPLPAQRWESKAVSVPEAEREYLERIASEVRISLMTSTFDRAHRREMSRLKPGAPRLRALQKRREFIAEGEGRFPTTTGSTIRARIHDVEFDGTHLFWHITPKDGKLSKWWEGTLMLGQDEDRPALSPTCDTKKPMSPAQLVRAHTEHLQQSLRIVMASHAPHVARHEETRRAEIEKRENRKPFDGPALQLAERELGRIAKLKHVSRTEKGCSRFRR